MVFERLRNIISENMGIEKEEITLETSFEDLGLDSLDLVELVMNVEDEFGIEIEEGKNFNTVKDVVDYIEERI
ncbi:acyl carrier protein [Caloramator sp. CAR-1]|uniref:acyl carrier protein n=1 Tax=Caloramator sp. CAR-1 TaxID=3062777 RepID=UPI0026E1820A|nr:acyl carrier protein [Caloramator sp. CAR-1]MDO6354036.1 acyl carrier protein [Caloramator sp. CAR-1]